MIIKKVFYVQDSIEKKTHHIGIYKGEICLSSETSSLSPGELISVSSLLTIYPGKHPSILCASSRSHDIETVTN
jgi:hypothetical protein